MRVKSSVFFTLCAVLSLAPLSCASTDPPDSAIQNCRAALAIQDSSRAKRLAKDLFDKYPDAESASLLIRAYCLTKETDLGLGIILSAPIKEKISRLDPTAISELSWSILREQLVASPSHIWLQVCASMQQVHEQSASQIVLMALDHPDLRVKLAALDLIACYPQDDYKQALVQQWQNSEHPFLRARMLDLASQLGWEIADLMGQELNNQAGKLTATETIALAGWKMSRARLSSESILELCKSSDNLSRRLGAWMLRYVDEKHIDPLKEACKELMRSSDYLTLQITLDSFVHFHLAILDHALQQSLKLIAKGSDAALALQAKITLALGGKDLEILELWQECLTHYLESEEAQSSWKLAQMSSVIALCASNHPQHLQRIWPSIDQLPWAARLQLAESVIRMRSLYPSSMLESAAELLERWIQQGPPLWWQASSWPNVMVLSTLPPGWMNSHAVHTSAQQLRWDMLEVLSCVKPQAAMNLALKEAKALPQFWSVPALLLSWRSTLQVQTMGWDEIDPKQRVWLKAALLGSKEDKEKLKQMWQIETLQWRHLILDAFLECADSSDLPFLLSALSEGSELRIKSCCAILMAVRRGRSIE